MSTNEPPFGPIHEDWSEDSIRKMFSDPGHLEAVMAREKDRLDRMAEHYGIDVPEKIVVKYTDGTEETWTL